MSVAGVLLVVACEPADTDELAGLLWAHGPLAVEERATPDGPALVAGFADRRAAVLATEDLDYRFTFELMDADDAALDGWRDHARAWRAGDRIVVTPTWVDPPDERPGDVVIRLDPGRAFGSGSHPSTRLALAALEQAVTPGCSVLDVGCGSGVLAVAAALLGAGRVVGVDTDPAAVKATAANARTNEVTVEVRAGSVDDAAGTYDVVVANLLAPTIRELGPRLRDRLAPSGTLILSGLLVDQAAVFAETLGGQMTIDGDWAAITA